MDGRLTQGPEREIAELREEIRRIREEQLKRDGRSENGEGKNDRPDQDHDPNREKGKNGGNGSGDEKAQSEKGQGEKPEEEKKPHPLRKAIMIAVAIVVVAGGVIWWLHGRNFESTDDATVDGHTSGLAARVSGTVVAVYVEENRFVSPGEVVVDLDPRDYEIAVEQARAQLTQAREQTLSEQPNIPVTQVTNSTDIATAKSAVSSAEAGVSVAERNYDAAVDKVHEAQANNAQAQADVERYRPLAEKDEVPREQFDQVVANANALAATVAANEATAQALLKQVDESRAQLEQAQQREAQAEKNAPRLVAIRQANATGRQAAAEAALAQLHQAELNLSYCKITTPVAGIIAKRMAEVGQNVTPGQQVLLIAQLDDLWVTANFRETQLRRMRAGQSVRIHVDALARDFDGYVDSMPATTGSVTSLLPPENATGNFVKVVQRLPVRIRFKKNQEGMERLRPGMSVEPKVAVQ